MSDLLLDEIPIVIARLTKEGKLTACNKAAIDFFGKVSRADASLLALAQRTFTEGEAISAHDHLLTHQGKEYRATVHILPRTHDALLTLDILTSPLSPTASAWKQQITRAAGVMAAMLAHEVKNPLSAIRGAAQLLAQNTSDAERPLADMIISESLRIRDLLDQVEIFSDGRVLPLSALNIHEVLHYSLQVAQAGFAAHVQFVEQYDPSLPPILSHRDALVQVFLNIIKNAAEALGTTPDARITIETSYQSGIKYSDRALPLVVSIRDNGPGIPAHLRDKLFEPFVSTKEKGRGLGLAAVGKLAGDVGAMVEIAEPADHIGTTMIIRLPRAS